MHTPALRVSRPRARPTCAISTPLLETVKSALSTPAVVLKIASAAAAASARSSAMARGASSPSVGAPDSACANAASTTSSAGPVSAASAVSDAGARLALARGLRGAVGLSRISKKAVGDFEGAGAGEAPPSGTAWSERAERLVAGCFRTAFTRFDSRAFASTFVKAVASSSGVEYSLPKVDFHASNSARSASASMASTVAVSIATTAGVGGSIVNAARVCFIADAKVAAISSAAAAEAPASAATSVPNKSRSSRLVMMRRSSSLVVTPPSDALVAPLLRSAVAMPRCTAAR